MNATCRNDAGMVDAWVFKTRVYRFIWDCVCDNVRSMSKDWCKCWCVVAFRGGDSESVLLLRTARMCVFDWLGYLNNLLTAKLLNRIPFLQIN